jgi:small GTP-binding protein
MSVATPPAPASTPTLPAADGTAPGCKLCLVGMPGVGRTSLLQRVLHDRFPAPPTPPGITVASHRWLQECDAPAATLWDVAGNSAIDSLNQAFLSRVDGIAAVAAIDDALSVERALQLVWQIRRLYPGTPATLLLNKSDLAARVAALPAPAADVAGVEVSARDGRGVQAAFLELARRAARHRVRA